MPALSIIIPVFNASNTLQTAIESVLMQRETDWELLIIDGGSTDGTLTLLGSYSNRPAIHWLSEPDRGIYDAMNKGIDRASGEWIYFLGADDQLVAPAVAEVLKQTPAECRIVFGDVQFENGYRMRSYLGPRTWLQNTLHHQAAFYHRSLFDTFRYDSSLKLLADYELNLQVYQQSVPTCYIDKLIAYCHSGGASSNWAASLRETNVVRSRFIKSAWKQAVMSTALTFYYGQKRLRRALYGHKI